MPTGSEHPAEITEALRFFEEFQAESDRALVVLGAAKLDSLLYQLLAKALLPSPTRQDDLLEAEHALGTFSSRIDAVYRLALIDRSFARALHLIRRVRNTYAHQLASSKLDQGPETDRIRELATLCEHNGHLALLKASLFPRQSGCRADFCASLAVVAARLMDAISEAKPANESDALNLIPPSWQQKRVSRLA